MLLNYKNYSFDLQCKLIDKVSLWRETFTLSGFKKPTDSKNITILHGNCEITPFLRILLTRCHYPNELLLKWLSSYPVDKYLFKVINKNTRLMSAMLFWMYLTHFMPMISFYTP